MPSTPTVEDLERLVARSFEEKALSEQADQVGLSQEKFVATLLPELPKIWEAASTALIELQKLEKDYENDVANSVSLALQSRTLFLRDVRGFGLTVGPIILLLYVLLRYSHWAQIVFDRIVRSPTGLTVASGALVIVLLFVVYNTIGATVIGAIVGRESRQGLIYYFSRVRFVFVSISFLLILYSVFRYFHSINFDVTRLYNAPLWLVLVIGFVIVSAYVGFYNGVKEPMANTTNLQNKIEQTNKFASLKKQIDEQQKKVDDVIITQGIKPRIRETLEPLLALPFSYHLPKLNYSGLAEVFNSANEIATDAKRELEFMLTSMPGGSIGIAGPRGSGKSTLLQSACKELPDNLTKRKVVPLFTTSPVEYDGRDFILHVFSSMCAKILNITGKEDKSHLPLEDITGARRSAAHTAYRIAKLLAMPALIAGSLLIALGTLLAVSKMNASTPTQPAAAPQVAAQPAATPVGPGAANQPTPVPPLTSNGLVRFAQALDLKPGPLFFWGLLLLLFFVVVVLIPGKPVRLQELTRALPITTAKRAPDSSSQSVIENLDLDDEIKKRLDQTSDKARVWLKDIRFQQSYTSGWSGSIKLPIGLEGGMSDAVTLAQHQLSLPDITKGFCDLVSGLGRDFKVIIGIDELDKLESDEAAQRFLNEIKAVFGLSNVFYLISVSENAMSNFERRGVPFRDVFDSSFDNIVYVDYLTLEYGRRLIARRVVGMPPPFVHLCYCISGGLARDLVRTCRNLSQYSLKAYEADPLGPDSNLKALSAALIKSDLRLKLHALTVVAKKLRPGAALDAFLKKLQILESQLDSAPSLISTYTELLKTARPAPERDSDDAATDFIDMYSRLKQRLSEERPSVSDSQALCALHEELATYIYYCVTVLQFFSEVLNPQTMVKAEAGKVFDELARARQYLAINASITRTMLDKFRGEFGMAVPVVN